MIIKEVVDACTVYPSLPDLTPTPTEHRLQQRGHLGDGVRVLLDVEAEQRHQNRHRVDGDDVFEEICYTLRDASGRTVEAVHAQRLRAATNDRALERVVVEADEEKVALFDVEGVRLLGQAAEVRGEQGGDPVLDHVALFAEVQRLLQLHCHVARQRREVYKSVGCPNPTSIVRRNDEKNVRFEQREIIAVSVQVLRRLAENLVALRLEHVGSLHDERIDEEERADDLGLALVRVDERGDGVERKGVDDDAHAVLLAALSAQAREHLGVDLRGDDVDGEVEERVHDGVLRRVERHVVYTSSHMGITTGVAVQLQRVHAQNHDLRAGGRRARVVVAGARHRHAHGSDAHGALIELDGEQEVLKHLREERVGGVEV